MLGQDLQHADLHGAPGAPAGEHEGGQGSLFLVVVGARQVGCPPLPGHGDALEGEAQDQHDQHQGGHHEDAEDHGKGGHGGVGHRQRG